MSGFLCDRRHDSLRLPAVHRSELDGNGLGGARLLDVFTDMRQLTGRTVAVNTLGNTAELGTRARLRQWGADPARVRLVEEESAQRVTMPAFRDSLDPADIQAAVDRAYDFGMLKGGSTPWRSYGRARPPVKAMLEVHNLRFVYPGPNGQGPTEAIGGRSLLVREREVVSIVGPSRCGKTTLVTCIIGLHPPTAGEVRLDGRRVTSPGDMLLVFQEYQRSLLPWRTVRGNVHRGGARPREAAACCRPSLGVIPVHDVAEPG